MKMLQDIATVRSLPNRSSKMKIKRMFKRAMVVCYLMGLVFMVFPQTQQTMTGTLSALLDTMLENHYLPSVQVGLGSFTYRDTQVPTPFARWFEDQLRLAIAQSKHLKLFDKQVAAAMDPAISALYKDFFGTDRADSILYGKYQQQADNVLVTITLTDLATGSLISEVQTAVPKTLIPADVVVQPSIQTLQTVASLSQIAGNKSNQTFSITLATNRGSGAAYRDGEKMVLFVTSNRDAYLKIYHVDVNGVAQLIWPNRFGGSGKIKAGEALKFPGDADRFQYVLGRPYGTEYIKAVASTEPFATMEADHTDLDGTAVNAITRGLSVVSANTTRAEALVVYEILP